MYRRKQVIQRKNSTPWPSKSRTAQKRKYWSKGVWSERLAALWLQLKGYQICERRYKTPVGEIDLIVRKKNLLVAVEVKARPSYDLGLESVTPHQQQRIRKAFEFFLTHRQNYVGSDLRFDVVVIQPWSWPRHLIHAWGA